MGWESVPTAARTAVLLFRPGGLGMAGGDVDLSGTSTPHRGLRISPSRTVGSHHPRMLRMPTTVSV